MGNLGTCPPVCQTDNIALDVARVGTATGAGAVSAAGGLDYNMVLKLTGLVAGAPAGNTANAGGGKAALIGGLMGMIPGGADGAASGLGAAGGLASGVLKNGIPVAIGGTTSNPTFAPNLRGLATGMEICGNLGKFGDAHHVNRIGADP